MFRLGFRPARGFQAEFGVVELCLLPCFMAFTGTSDGVHGVVTMSGILKLPVGAKLLRNIEGGVVF